MAFKRAHARVGERSTTSGNGPWTLGGAFDLSYQTFASFLSDGDTTEVHVVEPGVAGWTGIGTYTAAGGTISPTSVEETWGTFGSGTKEIFAGQLASRHLLREDISGITTGGTSTAYTAASFKGYSTLAKLDGQVIAITMHATSGAAPTLAVDGLTAKPLRVATGVAPQTGAFLSGNTYLVRYGNSVGEFLALGQVAVIPPGAVVTNSIVDANVTYPKIQNVAASRLLGNATGSPAAPAEVSLGANLQFSGSTVNLNPAFLIGFLSGLTLSTAGGSGTFGIAVGAASDAAGAGLMLLASAYTKTTSAWAVGSGNGGLDTGAIANNTWYHVYLIERPDTGVVDVIFSLNGTIPALPANYVYSRRLGAMRTDGSAHWTAFTQTGDVFLWNTEVADVSNATVVGSLTATTLTVPNNVTVAALIRASLNATTGTSGKLVALSETDQGVTTNTNTNIQAANNSIMAAQYEIMTNISAQIGVRFATSSAATYSINTYGWKDARGR